MIGLIQSHWACSPSTEIPSLLARTSPATAALSMKNSHPHSPQSQRTESKIKGHSICSCRDDPGKFSFGWSPPTSLSVEGAHFSTWGVCLFHLRYFFPSYRSRTGLVRKVSYTCLAKIEWLSNLWSKWLHLTYLHFLCSLFSSWLYPYSTSDYFLVFFGR